MPYLQLPSGQYLEIPKGMNPQEAIAKAQEQHPTAFLTPGEKEERQGFGAATGQAFREAKAATESGLGALLGSETLKGWGEQDKLTAQKNQFIPTTSEDVSAAMKEGLLPGAGAAFRKYVSEPVGGIVGRYGAPMAIGAGAAALAPEALVGAGGAALIGSAATALSDLPAEVAENLDRAKEQGNPQDVKKALGYGLIQAGLTGFGIPGTGLLTKAVNKFLGKEAVTLGEKVAEGSLTKEEAVAQLHGPLRNTLQSMGINAASGTAMMVGTEAARRAAAGQDVFSPEAFEAYKENAIGALELSPIFGALHGIPKRMGEKKAIEAAADKRQATLDKEKRIEEDKVAAEQADIAQQRQLQQQQLETGDLFGEPLEIGAKGKKLIEGAVSPLEKVPETRTVTEREDQQKAQQEQAKELFATHFDAERNVEKLEKELITAAQKGDLATITKIQPLLKNYREQVKTVGEELKKLSPIEESPEVLIATYRGQLKKKMAELAQYAESNPEKVDKLVPEIKELQAKIDEASKTIAPSTKSLPVTPGSGTQFEMFEPAAMAAEKKVDERAAKEQLAERQQDLFAQIEKARPKSEEIIDRYQQGLIDLEEAHAAGAPEKIINNLINKLREAALEKEASRARVVSGEELENQAQRVERLKRSLEESKNAYNESKSDAERQQHLATIGELEKRLATVQTERAQGRPEVVEKNAFAQQEEAKRDAVENVRSLLSGDYFNSKNVDVASSLKAGLENKIVDSGRLYAKAAIDEINAVRKQYKQESLSTDDALKLTQALRSRFNYLAKDPTYLAEKVRETNVKTFEESLERIKKNFFEGALNRKSGPFELVNKNNVPKNLRIKALEEKIKNIKPGSHTQVEAQLKKVEAQLADLDKEKPSIEIANKVAALKKEQRELRERVGRYYTKAGELSRKETLAALKAELEKVKAEPDVVEEQTPLKGQDLEKTGTYQTIDVTGEKINTPIYERKEQDTLTVREKEAGVKEPEGINPDQYSLFKNKELEPIATVRATPANFMRLVNIRGAKFNFAKKEAEAVLKKVTEEAKAKDAKWGKPVDKQTVKELMQNFNEQRELVQQITNVDKFRKIAQDLWKNSNDPDKLKIIDVLYKRADTFAKENLALEQGILNGLERKLKAIKDPTSVEAKRLAENKEKARAEVGKTEAEMAAMLQEKIKLRRETEQKFAEFNKSLATTTRTIEPFTKKVTEKIKNREVETEVAVGISARPEGIKKLKEEIKSLENILKNADITITEYAKQEKELSFLKNALKKSEDYAKVKKQIKEAEARMATLDKNSEKYKSEARNLNTLKNRRDQLAEPIRVEKITKTPVPKTEEEKITEAREAAVAADKEMQQTRILLGKGPQAKEEIQADIKAYIEALNQRKEKHFKDIKEAPIDARKKLEKKLDPIVKAIDEEIIKESKRLENIKKSAKLRADTARTLAIAGNNPEKLQRKKPLKTGVAKVEQDFKEAIESEKHGYGPKDDYYEGPTGNKYRLSKQSDNKIVVEKGREFVENLKKKLPKDVNVNYVDTFADLPAAEKQHLERDGVSEGSESAERVKGYVNQKGEVYIIGGNHADMKDLETTYAHELIGHVGVDRLLGNEGIDALVKRINDQHGGLLKLADTLGVREYIDGTLADYALTIKKRTEAGASKKVIDELMEDMERRAVKELIAHTAEQRATEGFVQKANRWMKELVGAVRAFLRDKGFAELSKVTTSDIFNIIRQSERSFQRNELGGFRTNDGNVVFRKDSVYNEKFNSNLKDTAGLIYKKEKTLFDRLKGNALGMTMAHRFVDRFAGLEYIARNMKDNLAGLQMMSWNRLYDQRNNMMSEIATHGPVGIVKDEKNNTYHYQSKKGPSLAKVAEVAGKAKSEIGNGTAALEQFGLYLAVERAASNKNGLAAGLKALNLEEKVTPQMADEVLNFGRGNTHFQEARKLYREYNNGQLDFMVESGRLSKAQAAEMKKGDYVAYYRVNKNDEVWDDERNIKVGDLKTQEYLRELLGGDSAIVNFETGALQNTYMLTDMAMGNIASKNTAFTLQTLGMAEIHKGDGPASKDVIRFYDNGEKMHAIINTSDAYKVMEKRLEKMREEGTANTPEYKKLRERAEASRESASMFGNIPSELIVKGMEGVSMTLPAAVSFLRGPANLLRKGITRNPAYAMRVAFKDSLSGWVTSGADTKPIMGTLDALSKMVKKEAPEIRILQEQGIIGGHVFSGTMSDMRTIALQMAEGKSGWEKLWAKADRLAIMADESARLALYNGFVKKGMSTMEASLATLEAQNFTKHGYSPTIRMLSTMIPFFNSQIQGLNVFARAISGKSLFEDRLGVRETMLKRGATIAGLTLGYTALMQNNEAYKNASEYDKLNYWFIPLPFFKDPIRVPIPFESGVVFKALPEAMYNLAATDAKSKDVLPAVGKLLVSQVPGVSNLFLPQGVKPIVEGLTNTDFYTMAPIESQRQLKELPGYRSNATTTELSKLVGRTFGVSPIQIDHFINGYADSIGTAMMSMFNPMLREGSVPDSTSKDIPFVGGFFQPTDATGLINKAYADMEDIEKANETYKRLNEENPDKADAFYKKYMNQIDNSTAAGMFKQQMGELNKQEREIRANKDLASSEKRKRLDENRQDKIQLAKDFRSISNE